MGCPDSKQQVSVPIHLPPLRNQKSYLDPPQNDACVMRSNASVMRSNDQTRNNFAQVNNMLGIMMAKMEKQDQIIAELMKKKTQTFPNSSKNYFSSASSKNIQSFQNISKKSIEDNILICQSCIHALPKFNALGEGLKNCKDCKGYGLKLGFSRTGLYCKKCARYEYPRFICEICFGRGVIQQK